MALIHMTRKECVLIYETKYDIIKLVPISIKIVTSKEKSDQKILNVLEMDFSLLPK